MGEPGGPQVSITDVVDWLVRELAFGVEMHTKSPPPWLPVRELAAAWQRLEGDGETVENWIWTIEAETGWSAQTAANEEADRHA